MEVSPSTEIWLKVAGTTVESAFCSTAGSTWASVVMKSSMVAMLGWIMPEPLAMAPMRQVLPPTVNSTANSLAWVSVVMMAVAASWLPSAVAASLAAAAGTPFSKGGQLHGLADDAGGGGQHVAGVDAQGFRHQITGILGQLDAIGCAGVGVAAVHHNGLGVAVLQVFPVSTVMGAPYTLLVV